MKRSFRSFSFLTYSCIVFAYVFACSLALPCFGRPPKPSQAERLSYQRISDSLLKCLSVDISQQNQELNPETPPTFSTVEYLEGNLAGRPFQDRFYCHIEKTRPESYSVSVGLTSAPPDFPEPLPQIYVFLPSIGQRRATFASFVSFDDPSLIRLPGELIDLTKHRLQTLVREWKEIGQWEESHLVIETDSLSLKLPATSSLDFLLISPTSVQRTRLKRIEVAIREWGSYQVYGEFTDTLSGAIFAYPVEDKVAPPKFVEIDSTVSTPVFDIRDYMISISIPGRNQVYSGSRFLVPTSVNLLWNNQDSSISRLDCSFGFNLGNEHPHFTQHYLLYYDHRYFVLRIDPQLAYLVRINEYDFLANTIADETAPDL